MFPCSGGDNPFPHHHHHQFPQYLFSSSFGLDNSEASSTRTSIHHHHYLNPPLDYPSSNPASENLNRYIRDQHALLMNKDSLPARSRPPAGKKDRHSKIVTAQGPRDRRVRMSIDIAKKFFGLQDMLGFDKASSTLDWLFTKSKLAIEELEQMQEQQQQNGVAAATPTNSLSSASETTGETTNGDSERGQQQVMMLSPTADTVKRESRAKARARARERTTRKKMCISPSTPNQDCTTTISSSEMEKKLNNSPVYGVQQQQQQPMTPPNETSPEEIFLPCAAAGNWDRSESAVATAMSSFTRPAGSSSPGMYAMPSPTPKVFQLRGQTWDLRTMTQQQL